MIEISGKPRSRWLSREQNPCVDSRGWKARGRTFTIAARGWSDSVGACGVADGLLDAALTLMLIFFGAFGTTPRWMYAVTAGFAASSSAMRS